MHPHPFPNKLNAIAQSPLPPNVAAPNHFVHWLTPFGINSMNCAAKNFPPETITRERFVLTQCVKPEPLSNYSTGLLCFMHFCNDFRIPEATLMPAKESLLCLFITSHGASRVGKGMLTSWLAGLELWHSINSTLWLGRMCLARTVKGAASFSATTSSQPLCLPITIHHLHILRHHLTLSDTFDVAIWAVAMVAFWCQCKQNELCNDTSFALTRHAIKTARRKHGFASNSVEYRGFFAPSMKTKTKGDWICWTDSGCECSALAAFHNHCVLNASVPSNVHLFAFETVDGSWAPVRRSLFMDRCNEVWSNSSISHLTGHSFCIGGTTYLLLLGVNPSIVMVQGRWKSDTFLAYWRNC